METEPQVSGQELPYTNRELREKWHDIENQLQRILNQTTLTNGRVGALEQWKHIGIGATTVLSFLIVPLLIWALSILVNMDIRIQESVDRALQAYDIVKTE